MAKSKPKTKTKDHSKTTQKSLKASKGAQRTIAPFQRIESGIPGLDTILSGGFLKGGTYLILGTPGTGKTIFANQLCFNHIGKGGKAIYVTLLAESHTRMFGNLQPLQFFHPEDVSEGIQYISGYSVLEKEGLDGLLRLLRDLVYQYGAKIIFIDGIASADELSGSTVAFKKFVHHLNSVLGMAGCTTFLLSSAAGDQTQPEYTMVDGILELTFCREGMKTAREVEVRKFRGSSHFYGKHFLEITEKGIQVFPRIEAAFGHEKPPKANLQSKKGFGIRKLDKMLNGGLVESSATSLLGPTGAGKTQFGMQFLIDGARNGESGLLFSMYEHPDRIEAKFNVMGNSISNYLKKGTISILRRKAGDHIFDKMIYQLLEEVEKKKIKRVFIDGINGFRINMLSPQRLGEIITALFHELRSKGVTIVITEETDVFASSFDGVISNHSAIIDNIFEFRHVDHGGSITQTLSIIKLRESLFDKAIYEINFTKSGIEIGNAMEYIKPHLPVVRIKGSGKTSR